MMDNDAYTGSIAKTHINFKHFNVKHFNVSQVAIYLNGEMPVPPLMLNFADNQYIDEYKSLIATVG